VEIIAVKKNPLRTTVAMHRGTEPEPAVQIDTAAGDGHGEPPVGSTDPLGERTRARGK